VKRLLALFLTLMTLRCGYGSPENNMGPGMVVQVDELSPNAAIAGGSGFLLTVNGSGFSMNSAVYWNSTPLITRFIAGRQLVAGVPAFEVANPGKVRVFVLTNGATSNTMTFNVKTN